MARIIVSGVGNGMGCNASRLLKSSGHDVAIISRGENGKKVAKDIGAHYSSCDLMNFKETANAISELSKKLGGLDALQPIPFPTPETIILAMVLHKHLHIFYLNDCNYHAEG